MEIIFLRTIWIFGAMIFLPWTEVLASFICAEIPCLEKEV